MIQVLREHKVAGAAQGLLDLKVPLDHQPLDHQMLLVLKVLLVQKVPQVLLVLLFSRKHSSRTSCWF